ncbi:MAG: hypothetical protein U0795_05155 [Pirellulales bacterium]
MQDRIESTSLAGIGGDDFGHRRGILPILAKIADTYRVALSTPMLALAVVGCLVVPLGWLLFDVLFAPPVEYRDAQLLKTWPGQSAQLNPWIGPAPTPLSAPGLAAGSGGAAGSLSTVGPDSDAEIAELAPPAASGSVPQPPAPPGGEQLAVVKSRTAAWLSTLHRSPRGFPEDPVLVVPYRMMRPFWRVFDRKLSWSAWAYFVLGALWTLGVWSLIGGAICRMAAVRLGRDERVGIREAMQYGVSRWTEFALAPLLPMLGIMLLAIPLVVLGLLMKTTVGLLLGGLSYILVLVVGLVMAILTLGLLAAWPLMWGAIASEGTDGFDAISRSYAYVMQRPFAWIGYLLVGVIVGLGGWMITTIFCEAVLAASFWGVAVGMGSERAAQIADWLNGGQATGVSLAGVWLISFAMDAVRLVASAVSYAHFWTLATAWYLLLRRDVDDTELSEIYLEDEDETRLGLPPTESVPPAERPSTVPLHGDSVSGEGEVGDG